MPITVTCMTPTGSQRIEALFADEPRIQHCYLPYDLPWAAARGFWRGCSKLAVIMETELWPNPSTSAPARVPWRWPMPALGVGQRRTRFAKLTRPMLEEMSLIAVQTEAEAERFRQLGARPECVQVTGSIKFDLTIDPQLLTAARAFMGNGRFRRWCGLRPAPMKERTKSSWRPIDSLLSHYPDALLILVPRHPERFNSVFELCQREGFDTVRRSTAAPVGPHTHVLLGDTMGELLFLYA